MNPFKAIGIVTKVGVQTTLGIVQGTIHTAGDCCKFAGCVIDKNPDGAFDIIGNRVNRTVHAVGSIAENTVELLDTAVDTNKTLWSEKNLEKMANVAVASLITAAGIDTVLDSDDSFIPSPDNAPDTWIDVPSDYVLATSFDLDPDAISNGMFVGNSGDLNDLIRAGEDPFSTHLATDEYARDIGLRDTFLSAHGWSELPDGYEVHHIMPLSQGGSDTIDNMILISEQEHDIVTAAHRKYYDW